MDSRLYRRVAVTARKGLTLEGLPHMLITCVGILENSVRPKKITFSDFSSTSPTPQSADASRRGWCLLICLLTAGGHLAVELFVRLERLEERALGHCPWTGGTPAALPCLRALLPVPREERSVVAGARSPVFVRNRNRNRRVRTGYSGWSVQAVKSGPQYPWNFLPEY